MGVIADFLAASVTVDTALPISALDRREYRELKAIQAAGDFDLPAALQAADEVQSIAVYEGTVSGGTFTLAVTLASGETFTTAAIAFDANAAAIEGAIDTAATAAGITDWTNGDISVAGGPLTTTPVTLTFDGDSADAANHALTVMDGSLLTGGGSGGAVTVTTEGQAGRLGYAILTGMGILSGTVPAEGATPSSLAVFASPGERCLSAETIRAVALEIAIAEGNEDIYSAIVAAAKV